MNDLKHFILVGAPASGKGTQGKFLANQFRLETLSTGALLRREIESGSEIGRKTASYMSKAQLVPDEIVNEIVNAWLDREDDHAWLLDGYPRTIAQAEALDRSLSRKGMSIDCVVWMDVSRELIEQRILNRRECERCGHIVQIPIEQCLECGGKLVTRKDDNPEAFARRWKDFENMTLPVIKYYEAKGLLVKVSVATEREPEDVSQELLDALNDFANKGK